MSNVVASVLMFLISSFMGQHPIKGGYNSYKPAYFDNERYFVANYAVVNKARKGKFLAAPVLFKLSETRDTMFVICAGTYSLARRVVFPAVYQLGSGTYVNIEDGFVSMYPSDSLRIDLISKSML